MKILLLLLLSGCVGAVANELASDHRDIDKALTGAFTGAVAVTTLAAPKLIQASKDIRDSKAELAAVKAEGEKLKKSHKKRLAEVDQALQSLEAERQSLSSQLESTEKQSIAKLLEVRTAIESREQQINKLTAQVSQLSAELAEAQEEADQLEQANQEWLEKFDGLKKRLKAEADKQAQVEFNPTIRRAKNHARQVVERSLRKQFQPIEEENKQLKTELQQATQENNRLTEEFVNARQTVSEFSRDRYDEIHDEYAEKIDALTLQIRLKQAEIEQLKLPRKFAKRDFHERGNRIIDKALEWADIRLDGVWRSPDKTGRTTYYYAPSVVHANISPSSLIESLNRRKADFKRELDCRAISSFEYDPERLMLRVTVESFDKAVTKDELESIWTPSKHFKRIALNEKCFRITGGKGAAKSPTSRNIFGCKLENGEKFEIIRFDPTEGSPKDYHRVAPRWTGYTDAVVMAREIIELIPARKKRLKKGEDLVTRYYWIDELENTLKYLSTNDREDDAKLVVDAVIMAAKECDHSKVGVLICTQNPNVSKLKYLDRADFDNFTSIHIGGSGIHATANSNRATGKADIEIQMRRISDYCEKQNEGVDDPARQIRYALVEKQGKNPKLIELPQPGEYGFDLQTPGNEFEFERFSTRDYPDEITSLDDAARFLKRMKLNRLLSVCTGGTEPAHNRQNNVNTSLSLSTEDIGTEAEQSENYCYVKPVLDYEKEDNDGLPPENGVTCPVCGSPEVKKNGEYQARQRYRCLSKSHPDSESRGFYGE